MSKLLVVTGAAGFLGRAVVNQALSDPAIKHVLACDRTPLGLTHPKLSSLTCDLGASRLTHALARADVVIHLGATLGAAAEADPSAARKVNLDATLDLIAACDRDTRFVFASSLAVLGETSGDRAPVMVYGSHKAMAEIALETTTRRREIDGVSLRPGGIVARADDGSGLKSAFLSQMFWAISKGRDLTLPVAPDAMTWLSSVGNVAANFLHAALTPNIGEARSLTLPMTKIRYDELVTALLAAYPNSTSKITYSPDADAMRLFGHASRLCVEPALAAGFHPDTNLASLIKDALQHGDLQ